MRHRYDLLLNRDERVSRLRAHYETLFIEKVNAPKEDEVLVVERATERSSTSKRGQGRAIPLEWKSIVGFTRLLYDRFIYGTIPKLLSSRFVV